ncbi:MAG TPA: DEAD/DEAH box helicase [Polyangiaceae bacterium]|nr:DEAD/DEAH box helicase [Polyangiaceae bacterium]
MTDPDQRPTIDDVPSSFREALEARGFTELTLVQRAVLGASLAEADLRVSSQTGSGKTVAVGLVLAQLFRREELIPGRNPFALVIAPTRELAAQVGAELSWFFAPVSAEVVVVTGGTSGGLERRALSRGASIVVGTPGRLLDHLKRGSIDPSSVRSVVLDEADRMLDMGFTEDLRAILDAVPEGRRTHMVSATFPREVLRLADAYQSNVVDVEGTRRGDANEDIAHVVHIVPYSDREAAVMNVLLTAPDESTLAFTKTRDGASELAHALIRAGFSATALTGDMEQSERTRALDSFRVGRTRVLVATDVAARGIDLPDVTRVLHADPPGDPESYTHRSGRTGRAGRKGTSIMLVPPASKELARRLLKRAGIYADLLPIPTPEDVRRAQAIRLSEVLAADDDAPLAHAEVGARVAKELLGKVEPEALVARLVSRLLAATAAEPRPLSAHARAVRAYGEGDARAPERDRGARDDRAPRYERPTRPGAPAFSRGDERPRPPYGPSAGGPRSYADAPPRAAHAAHATHATHDSGRAPHAPRGPHAPHRANDAVDFVGFRVTWGARHGADARRLMALSCRRGAVGGADLGAIHVGPEASVVEVNAAVADAFERAARRPDPRDPRVQFSRTEHARDTRPGAAPSSPYLPVDDDEPPRPRRPWAPSARPAAGPPAGLEKPKRRLRD